jgi:oligopeptidase A
MIDFNSQNLVQNIQQIINGAAYKIKLASSGSTWDEVFNPLDEVMDVLGKQSAINSHLNAVNFSDEFNAEYEKTLPLLSNFYTDLGTNLELYQAYKNLEKQDLDVNQQYILTNVLRNFELSGINLTQVKQQKFKQLSSELSLLANDFAKNALQATNTYSEEVGIDELSGLSATDLATLKKEDKYYLSLQAPNYIAVMSFCENEQVREKLYRAYVARASELDGFDNCENITTILIKRKQLANLLGFKNYAEYSLATKMVKNPNEVEEFILELITKVKPQAQQELQALEEFAGKKLNAWDLMYYSEKLKKQEFGIDKQELKKYFPFAKVLTGLLDLICELYQLKYQKNTLKAYGQELEKISFFSFENKLIGEVILDGFSRANKKSGAWMADYQGLNTTQKPIAFVVCNASRPTENTPSLFDFDDVITLFHEFGHALHHILTTTKYPSVAGINGVPWDGVELPSQYMEFFAYEVEVITQISGHYQTNEPLPNKMLKQIIQAKNFNSALTTLRQCEFALWDICTHTSDKNSYEILTTVRELTALVPTPKDNYFLNSFNHIFAGGYAAGYYSYKWAEVMAADAYKIVADNRRKTTDFRQNILAVGGSCDFFEAYLKFSDNKKPNINSLLELSAIKCPL